VVIGATIATASFAALLIFPVVIETLRAVV
jgi:hypothetical protein